ncbi:MAG: CoxG family protein [Thermoplasmata archaeon]
MEVKGEFEVRSGRDKIYDFFEDVEKVAAIIPGLISTEKIDRYSARLQVKAGVSYIKGRFNVLLEVVKPVKYQPIVVSGKGSGSGNSLNLKAVYNIDEYIPGASRITWTVDLTFGGVAATMGARLINGTVEKYTDELADAFKKAIEA